MEAVTSALQEFFNTMIIPAIIAGGGCLLVLIRKCVKNIMKQIEIRSELENMSKTQEIKNKLLSEIKTIVDSTVGSNMQIADAMKEENGGSLTDQQSSDIKNSVADIVIASLPPSLTDEGGVLLEVMGGWDRLQIIINSMIDSAVYDYKIKKNSKKT